MAGLDLDVFSFDIAEITQARPKIVQSSESSSFVWRGKEIQVTDPGNARRLLRLRR